MMLVRVVSLVVCRSAGASSAGCGRGAGAGRVS